MKRLLFLFSLFVCLVSAQTQTTEPSMLKQAGATDGQALVWNNTAGQWEPGTVSGGGPDSVGTSELDDNTDTPGSGDYIRVDTVDQAGVEYRTPSEVLSDIGAAASSHTHNEVDINDLQHRTAGAGLADNGDALDLDISGQTNQADPADLDRLVYERDSDGALRDMTIGELKTEIGAGSGNMSQAAENDTDNQVPVAVGTSGRDFEPSGVTIDPSTGDTDVPGDLSVTGSITAGGGGPDLASWNPPCIVLHDDAADLTDTLDIGTVHWFEKFGINLTHLRCETDNNTATINLNRDDGTPAVVLSSGLVCDTDGQSTCADSATETLSEPAFTTTNNWTPAGDFAVGSGDATYTHSTGSGTLTQASVDFANPATGNAFYRFTYTVSGFSADADATITTSFAASSVDLDISNGVHSVRFQAAASPGDFVISGTSTSGGFSLDDLSLVEAPCEVDVIQAAEDNFAVGDKMDFTTVSIDTGVRSLKVCPSGVME